MSAIQFFYRRSQLCPSHRQTLQLESVLAMSRIITNHLLANAKPGSRAIASESSLNRYLDCEQLVLKWLSQSDGMVFKDLSAGLLESIIIAWLSEWDDQQAKRIAPMVFKQLRAEQRVWLLSNSLLDYQQDEVRLLGDSDPIRFKKANQTLSIRPTSFILERNRAGQYWLSSLHERVQDSAFKDQDETVTGWGNQILNMEREIRKCSYYKESKYDKGRALEQAIMGIRKQTIHRLSRESLAAKTPGEPGSSSHYHKEHETYV